MLYTIFNDQLSVTISLKGAELKSIQKDQVEYLHDGNPKYWGRTAPYLFPNIGVILDGKTKFGDEYYPLTKHGFIRDQVFTLKEQKDNFISLTFKATTDTLKLYPFDFVFEVSYELKKDTLHSQIQITNLSGQVMPFNLGLHPAFKVPLFEDEKFEDYQIIFSQMQSFKVPSVLGNGTIDPTKIAREYTKLKVLPLKYEDYENDALIFDNIKGKAVYLFNNQTKKGVKFSFKDFKTLGIWTPNHINSPFICIEPWLGWADEPNSNHDFNEKKDLIKLDPNKSFVTTYKIQIL